MYHSIRRLRFLVTILLEIVHSIDLIFDMYIHGTHGNVIDYIILTCYVIKDHLWTVRIKKCGGWEKFRKNWIGD